MTLIEVLLILGLLGVISMVSVAGWKTLQRSTEVNSAARVMKMFVYQARMYSIYNSVSHFVVYNPSTRELALYADDGTTQGIFDTADRRIARAQIPAHVRLALPTEPANLTNPFTGDTLADAWSLPAPDSSAAWGTGRIGWMVNSRGVAESGEAVPRPIGDAVIVFSDDRNATSSVVLRGRFGAVSAFEFQHGTWREM